MRVVAPSSAVADGHGIAAFAFLCECSLCHACARWRRDTRFGETVALVDQQDDKHALAESVVDFL